MGAFLSSFKSKAEDAANRVCKVWQRVHGQQVLHYGVIPAIFAFGNKISPSGSRLF